jgi:A/G-specific adenine glycosylase
MICDEYGGVFPQEFNEIIKLPGIGTYTAGAISSIAFGRPRAAVDGNVLRVITRITEDPHDIMDEKFRKSMTACLEKIYPAGKCSEFTQSLMELGAIICVPNGAPRCSDCPLSTHCLAAKHNTQADYPVKKKKAERKVEKKCVFLLCHEDKVAFVKRQEEGLLSGMWQFPNIEGHLTLEEAKSWVEAVGLKPVSITEKAEKKHIFTHIEWHMQCFLVQCIDKCITLNCDNAQLLNAFTWINIEDISTEVALPTAFKKFMTYLP